MGARPPLLSKENFLNYPDPIYRMALYRQCSAAELNTIKRLGFDTVGVDFFWGDLEPQKEKYSWEKIDKFIHLASEANLKVGLRVLMWNFPSWIKSRMLSDQGDIGICPSNWDKDLLERLPLLWRKIAERYRNCPDVVIYRPTIGLHDAPLHGSYDKPPSQERLYDYSLPAQNAWQKYIREKIGSLDEVGKLYGHGFDKWEDIKVPLACDFKGEKAFSKLWQLFLDFRTEGVANAYEKIWKAIREVDEKAAIEIVEGSNTIIARMKGFDWQRIFNACKKYGVTFSHTGAQSISTAALFGDLAEQYAVPLEFEIGPNAPSKEPTIKSLGHAIKYNSIDQYYCGWRIMDQPTSNEWSSIKPFYKMLRNSKRITDNIILCGFSQYDCFDQEQINLMTGYHIPYYEALAFGGFQYRVVTAASPLKYFTEKNTVFFDANTYRINEKNAKLVELALSRGNTYIATWLTDIANNRRFVRKFIKIKEDVKNSKVTYTTCLGEKIILKDTSGVKLTKDSNTKVLAEWGDGTPAAVLKKLPEKGYLVMIGFSLIDKYYSTDAAGIILKDVLSRVGVSRHLKYDGAEIETALLKKGGKYYLLAINFASKDRNVKFDCFFAQKDRNFFVKDLFVNSHLSTMPEGDGFISFTSEISGYGFKIFEIYKKPKQTNKKIP